MSAEEPTPPPARRPWTDEVSEGVLVVVVVAILALMLEGGHFHWLLWSDRDLVRTAALAEGWVTTGPELSFGAGGRIPGGALHYVLAPAVFADGHPLTVWRWVALLVAGSLPVLFAAGKRYLGTWAAFVACAAWITSEAVADALWTLWNPALLPLFVAVAYAAFLRLVADRDGRALPVWALALALAAQMHFSGALLAAAMAVPVALARPAVGRRHALLAVAAVLLAYAPYLVDEVARDFPNTRLLLGQAGPTPGHGAPVVARNVGAFVRAMAGVTPATLAPLPLEEGWRATALTGARWGLLLVGVGAALARLRRGDLGPRGRAVLGLAFLVPAVGLFYIPQGGFQLGASLARRFVVVLLPAAALLVGAGGQRLVEALRGRGRRGLAGAVVLAITGLLVAQGWTAWERWERHGVGISVWADRVAALDATREATGWSLAELAGRTVIVPGDGPGFGRGWLQVDGVDYLLRRAGEAFPGSLPPPCAVIFQDALYPPAGPATVEHVATALGRPAEGLRVLRTVPAEADLVVLYDTDDDRCATSLVDRYLPTGAEEVTRAWLPRLAEGEAAEVEGPAPGVRRIVARATSRYGVSPRPVMVAVDLHAVDGGLRAVLHSNQLRGHAYNQRFLANARVRHPRLVLRRGDEERSLVFATGPVGHFGAVTPLAARLDDLPGGAWEVTLTWDDEVGPEGVYGAAAAPRESVPVTIPLVADLVVQGGEVVGSTALPPATP